MSTPTVSHALELLLDDPELSAMDLPKALAHLQEKGVWPSIVKAYKYERLRQMRRLDMRAAVKLAKSYVKATKYRRAHGELAEEGHTHALREAKDVARPE